MTKGKKQHAQVISFLDGASTRIELGDDDLLACGAALEAGVLDSKGRKLVPVSPRGWEVPRLKVRQTSLGALAPTLLAAMGLEEIVWDAVLSKSRPRCEACGVLADRSEAIDVALWPSQGYVALVVDGVDESISLREQCEFSGFERAVVAGRLVRVEDLDDETGEPVLNLFPATQRSDAERALEEWFNRGGVVIRIVHFLSREAEAREVQKVYRSWRCPSCARSFGAVTTQAIEESESCRRCRGEGWLLVDDNRLVACDDCDGFAHSTPLSRYEFLGQPLVAAATLSLSHVREEIQHEISSAERERLEVLCDAGFGSYPIGAPEALLSRGERVLATLASIRMSKPQSLLAVVTGEGGEGEGGPVSHLVRALGEDQSRIVTPVGWVPAERPVQTSSDEIVSVRDVVRGPLSIQSLSFARGALTVVQGEAGTGKTLLLSEIYKRFAKRKKLSHVGSFGTLKRCFMLERSHTSTGVLLDLLSLGSEFAAEVAKTRVAKERGVVEDDLLTARSKNLCGECSGGRDGVGERCPVCLGSVFDNRIGSLPFGRLSVSEIMRRPLSEVLSVLSLNDSVMAVLSAIPEGIRGRLSFGASVASLEPALRAFLEMSAGIARCLTVGGSQKDTLLLIDDPFATTASFQKLIFDSMVTFLEAGGTILCAAVPKPLENVASCVVRLVPSGGEQVASRQERFFDLRVSRRVSVHIER